MDQDKQSEDIPKYYSDKSDDEYKYPDEESRRSSRQRDNKYIPRRYRRSYYDSLEPRDNYKRRNRNQRDSDDEEESNTKNRKNVSHKAKKVELTSILLEGHSDLIKVPVSRVLSVQDHDDPKSFLNKQSNLAQNILLLLEDDSDVMKGADKKENKSDIIVSNEIEQINITTQEDIQEQNNEEDEILINNEDYSL